MSNRKIVQSKHVGAKWEKMFFLEVQQAILDGWRIVDNDVLADQSRRLHAGRWGRVVLYKPGEDVLEDSDEDVLCLKQNAVEVNTGSPETIVEDAQEEIKKPGRKTKAKKEEA